MKPGFNAWGHLLLSQYAAFVNPHQHPHQLAGEDFLTDYQI